MQTAVMKRSLSHIINRLLRRKGVNAVNQQPKKKQIFSIGIYAGRSPVELSPLGQPSSPVLTRESVSDVPAVFVADPFMLNVNGTWYMFFEVMNAAAGKGEIGLATSQNAVQWQYQQIVLRETFHLSYPYTFQWNNTYYMVPESHQTNSVRLYKALDFPIRWTFVKTLLDGDNFVDPTIFYWNDRWWLFTDFARPPYYAGTLRLFHADHLEGPWAEHPGSPVIQGDPHISRPAGRVVHLNGTVIRFTQDCCPDYGIRVRAFEITELTPTIYRERAVDLPPVVDAGANKWNESGMHHVDPHPTEQGQWIACVDGFYWKI